MARTPGSGWGAGPILWQICPECGKKKCYYDPIRDESAKHYKPFRCTSCKDKFGKPNRFDSETLIKKTH